MIRTREPQARHDRYRDEIELRVRRLRDIVDSGADLSVTVPTCPDWTLEQLPGHTGGALRWVDVAVRIRATTLLREEDIPLYEAPGSGATGQRRRVGPAATGESVVAALSEAGPDTRVWAWGWGGTPPGSGPAEWPMGRSFTERT